MSGHPVNADLDRLTRRKSQLTRHELSAARRQLEQLLAQLELDDRHRAIRPKTYFKCYFDSAHVHEMVLGMYAIESKGVAGVKGRTAFNLTAIENQAILIQALAAAGYLGSISMLLPHQAEFERRRRLRFGITFEPSHEPKAMATSFIEAVLKESDIPIEVRTKTTFWQQDVIRTLADRFSPRMQFQYLHCIQGQPSNYERLLDDGILKLGSYDPDTFVDLVADNIFPRIYSAFDRLRPGFTANNKVDAMAAVSLARKVADYADGRTDEAPRYFASTRTLARLLLQVLKSSRTYEKFCYEIEGQKIEAIRSWEYFLFQAVVGTAFERVGSLGDEQDQELPSKTSRLQDFIQTVRRIKNPDEQSVWVGLPYSEGGLQHRLNDLIDAAFLGSALTPELEKLRMRAVSTLKNDIPLAKQFSRPLMDDSSISETKVFVWDMLVRATDIWWVFARLREEFVLRHRRIPLKERWIWQNMRLSHLNLPPSIVDTVTKWIFTTLGLSSSVSDSDKNAVWQTIMKTYNSARSPDSIKRLRLEEDIGSVAAILLAGRDREFYEMTLDLLEDATVFDDAPTWLTLMRLQCAVMLQRHTEVTEFITILEGQHKLEPTAGTALGLAVMYGKVAGMPSFKQSANRGRQLFQHCLVFCQRARELPGRNELIAASSWNAALSASLYQVPWAEARADEAYIRLLDFESSDAWQFIFDYTLLEYFTKKIKKAKIKSDEVETHLRAAERSMRRAKAGPEYRDLQPIIFQYVKAKRAFRDRVKRRPK